MESHGPDPEREAVPATVVLDCDHGRAKGCASFCCRLIVRLEPGESDPIDKNPKKRCVDKNPLDGLCIYFDRESHRCTVWEQRPRVCRGYDCNQDPLLQTVMTEGFVSLVRLVRSATTNPKSGPIHQVPYVGASSRRDDPPAREDEGDGVSAELEPQEPFVAMTQQDEVGA